MEGDEINDPGDEIKIELNNKNESEIEKDLKEIEENQKEVKEVCDNYIYVFLVFFIQSLISLGCFYLYYITKFSIKSFSTYLATIISLFVIFFFIFGGLILSISKSRFVIKRKKSGNLILFILINIQKIIFEILIYIVYFAPAKDVYVKMFGEDNEKFFVDELQYQEFEARAYWKISMCFLYYMLIVYYYFKKEKTTFKNLFLLPFILISLSMAYLLIFFTQKSTYSQYRIGNHFALMVTEVVFLILFLNEEYYMRKKYPKFVDEINWKVNRIDFFRYNPIFYFFYSCC